MSKPGKWLVYAQHECLYITGPCYSGDHIVAGMNLHVCPNCGEPCDLFHRDTWAKVICRKVSDRIWWNPRTWGQYHLEFRSRGFLEAEGYNYRKFMLNAKKSDEIEPRTSVRASSRAAAPSPQ